MTDRREEPGSDEQLGEEGLERERERLAQERKAVREEDIRTAEQPDDGPG